MMNKGNPSRMGFGTRGQGAPGGAVAQTVPIRVLAVDDEATARAAIEETLAREGYDVQTVSCYQDWEQAWARGPRPNLIILDINLAERRGGYEILRALRKQNASIPVLMLSARNTAADAAFAQANGASAFVSKAEGEFGHATRGLVATVRRLLIA